VTKIDFDIPAIASVCGLLFIAAITLRCCTSGHHHPALRGMEKGQAATANLRQMLRKRPGLRWVARPLPFLRPFLLRTK
jgi:hypothetical protein